MSADSGARARWSAPWIVAAIATGAALTGSESVLFELKGHYFTGGFLALEPLRTPAEVAAFVGSSLVVDLALILAVWALVLPVIARLLLSVWQRMALAALVALVGPLSFDFVRHELQGFLGDVVDLDLLLTLAGNWPLEWLAQGASQILPVALALAGALALAILGIALLRRLPGGDVAPPRRRAIAGVFGIALGVSCVSVPSFCLSESPVCHGLRRKPAGQLLIAAIETLTDVDFDGAGLLARPPDPDPFDGDVHVYAVDHPGNGLDENGLAGDHPPATPPPDAARTVGSPDGPRRPHVLLVFLETFRGDLLEAEVNGREVTPFLNALARSGAKSKRAYVPAPYTVMARAQLFGGRVDPWRGQDTLIDDFAGLGYTVAYFSAQDDDFGDSRELVGFDRVDHYYDAKQDRGDRASRFSSSGSLAVSWKRLNGRIDTYLDSYADDAPLFLYVNYHDTHFPYHHTELDDVLGIDPLPRHLIRAETRLRLWETYANAAANVDRAIEALVAELRAHFGADVPLAVLVTADHGEALFEDGFLGHGSALDDIQTRVPLVLAGLGGEWPEPLSLADLRAHLIAGLGEMPADGRAPRPRLTTPPGRAILQFMSKLEHPRLLARRTGSGALFYDVKHDGLTRLPAEGASIEIVERDGADFTAMIRAWEATRLARSAR